VAEKNLITLKDIRNNPVLNEAMIMPGDTYTIGEDGGWDITRVWSDPNQKLDLGLEVTEQDLKERPELIDLDFEVGDRYIPSDHRLIKTGADSGWKQFMYGFDEEQTLLDNVSNVAESWLDDIGIDIGRFDLFTDEGILDYKTPEEIYGPEWRDADSNTQRAMIRAYDERRLLDYYGRYFEPDADSTARTVGQLTAAIGADPTSALPFGGVALKGLKAAQKAKQLGTGMGIAGGLGGVYSGSEDLAKGGTWKDIDLKKLGATAGVSAGGVGVLGGAGLGVSKLISTSQKNTANKLLDQAQQRINQRVSVGANPNFVRTDLNEKLMNSGKGSIVQAEEITGRKLSIPESRTSAQQLLKDAVEDQTVARFRNKGLNAFLGSISTTLRNIPGAEPIFMRLRKFELDSRVNTSKYLERVESFGKSLKKIKGQAKTTLTRHLANEEFDKARAMMSPQMKEEFKKVQEVLGELGHGLKAAGVEVNIRDNYFPRLIKGEKGYNKLLDKIGIKQQNDLQKVLAQEANRISIKLDDLPTWRKYEIANQFMKGYRKTQGAVKGDFTKARKIDKVTDDILPFYSSPEKALNMYVRNAVNSIERAKFFGLNQKGKGYRSIQIEKNAPVKNIEESIGGLTTKYMLNRPPRELDEVRSLLKSRFDGGEKSSSTPFGILRDLGYIGTIANPISAVTQLGDIGVSGALHGFRNTLAGMFGKKYVKLIDIGLTDVGQEMAEQRATATALRKLFGLSGFRKVDTLGKESSMNAALRKNFKLVNRKSKGKLSGLTGEQEFRKKWGKAYSDDINNVVADFKSGKVTDRIKFHAFNELSDMQPISAMEMPQKYLDVPNGRILYALKTFTLKQYDIVRREVIQEFAKPGIVNKISAIKKAGLLAGYLSAANVGTQAIKDIMLGRDLDLDNIPDKAISALLGVYGFNKYGYDKYIKQGKLTDWAVNTISPALPLIDSATTLGYEATEEDPDFGAVVRPVPIVGNIVYNWILGGAEKYNEKIEKERIKEWWE